MSYRARFRVRSELWGDMNRCNRFCHSVAVAVLISVGLFLGACEKKPVAPPTPQQQYLFHTISYPGETLGIIASWYTGNVQNWTVIRNANPELDPTKLRLGSVVRIPRGLVVKDAPLPKSAVGSTSKAARAQDPSLNPNQPKVEVPTEQPTIIPPPDLAPEAEPTVAPILDELNTPPEPEAAPVAEDVAIPEPTAVPAAPEVTSPKGEEGRVKSRDELLKELLEDY